MTYKELIDWLRGLEVSIVEKHPTLADLEEGQWVTSQPNQIFPTRAIRHIFETLGLDYNTVGPDLKE